MTTHSTGSQLNHYNRPPIILDKDNKKITIRASQAAACRRQLAYHALNTPISNPPDNIAINRMLAGTYLEAVALDYLKRTEWSNVTSFTDDYTEPPRLNINLTNYINITGTPDAYGSHASITDNLSNVIEVKTRGNAAWTQMDKLGTLGAFPAAIAQLALYRKGLLQYQEDNNVNIIHPESTGILVSMNTDTKDVRIFTATHMNLENTLTDLIARLTPLALLLLNKETENSLPSRDYVKTSWQCRYCPFFTTCYDEKIKNTSELINTEHYNPTKITKLEAISALHTYETAASQKTNNKIYDTDQKVARETLLNFLKGEKLENIELLGKTGISKKIKLIKRETQQIDLEKLAQLVSTSHYNDIVTLKVTESISIR